MTKPKVFVTRGLLEPGPSILQRYCELEIWPNAQPPNRSVLMEKVKRIDGLVSFLTDSIDKEVVDACDHVKVISQVAVGYDNIDVDAATNKNIVVTNTPGVLTETTADFTFALLLASARRIVEADQYLRTGQWQIPWALDMMLGLDIHERILGIVGLGRIGQAVARRAQGFNMRICYYDVNPRPEIEQELGLERVSFEQLLKESDFISLHVPLTSKTRGMIGTAELKKMKASACLINTSRGAVIDQDALMQALKEKRIAYAGLDVFEAEPIPTDHPLVQLENVILTPHIASASIATRSKMAQIAAENCVAVLSQKMPSNPVNADLAKQLFDG